MTMTGVSGAISRSAFIASSGVFPGKIAAMSCRLGMNRSMRPRRRAISDDGTSLEPPVVEVDGYEARGPGAQRRGKLEVKFPRQRREMAERVRALVQVCDVWAEFLPFAHAGAKDEVPRAVLFIKAPVAQRSGNWPAALKFDPVLELRDRIIRADRGHDLRSLAPERHSERGVDRIAARDAPHGRSIGEDEIVDGDVSEGEVLGPAHARNPARVTVNCTISEL